MKKILEKIPNFSIGVLVFVLLSILLPSLDVITDLLMVEKLFTGNYGCVNPMWWSQHYQQWQNCLKDPENYCSENRSFNSTCLLNTEGIVRYECRDPELWSPHYRQWHYCLDSPETFRQGHEAEHVCQFQSHPMFGLSLLVPCLINYFLCFLTWWRLDTMKMKTFIFPLLNLYPQLGGDFRGK